jgi:hypothetical protein
MVLLTGAILLGLARLNSRATTDALVHRLFQEVTGHAVTHTQAFVLRAAPLVESMRQLGNDGLALKDTDQLATQLLAVLRANPGLSWVSYGDRDGSFTGAYRPETGGLRLNQSRIVDGKSRLIERDVLPDGTWRVWREVDDSQYDPRKRPYYVQAEQAGRLVWLRPYVFFSQGIPGISCAAPVHDEAGHVLGVLSIDFLLDSLSEFVGSLTVSEHSKVILFADDGVLLAYPHEISQTRRESSEKLVSLAESNDPLIVAFYEALTNRHGMPTPEEPFHRFEFDHESQSYLASSRSFRLGEDLAWVVGVIAPKSDFFAGIWREQRLALVAAGVSVALAIVVAAALAGRVSGPVLSLIGFMKRVGGGDLSERANLGGGREFRELSSALNCMIDDLKDRLRLRHSLDLAMQVQKRLLPERPPSFHGLDIAGHSTYCDETGGDYYDFLVLDETTPNTMLVALGDVMGHGVAAALVMAGARAVLRDRANSAGGLAELMARLNRMLSQDLDGSRFMTMHLALVNTTEMAYRFVSAGHDPAIVFDPATGDFVEMEAGDMPLGVLAEQEFSEHEFCPLRPGLVVFVGTDGVWEMQNPSGEFFGKDRLRAILRETANHSAQDTVNLLLERLSAFRGDLRPMDDVTFLVIKVGKYEPSA